MPGCPLRLAASGRRFAGQLRSPAARFLSTSHSAFAATGRRRLPQFSSRIPPSNPGFPQPDANPARNMAAQLNRFGGAAAQQLAAQQQSGLVQEPPAAVRASLKKQGLTCSRVHRNRAIGDLYKLAVLEDPDMQISSTGALAALSYEKTGRSPKDKRIVEEPSSKDKVWWGDVNIPLPPSSFLINRQAAIDYLNSKDEVYCVDAFASWDKEHQVKIRVICGRAYHALFMHNMLIRPTPEQLDNFGEPDFIIYNAGEFPANPNVPGVTSPTSIAIDFGRQEMVILGSQYAGEMKKGVFSVMHYLAPDKNHLSLHSSANEDPESGATALFFGLSGTGKTTLSADPRRLLIGDDEHIWTDTGIFNIEGGCYAKCVGLNVESEPEIFNAVRFGSVLENVVIDPATGLVDYEDTSLTQNTRCSYPIEFIPNSKIPCHGGHPSNIIFLTCDAFGVLPPVSKLSPEQAMYHFISGFTSKMAGTEMGVTDPEATFSACFGAAFLVRHPAVYATLLAQKMKENKAACWLVNTGWSGGPAVPAGVAAEEQKEDMVAAGARIKLRFTRAIIDAIHDGSLAQAETQSLPVFDIAVPVSCAGVPTEILLPKNTWRNKAAYDQKLQQLGKMFAENFKQFEDGCPVEVVQAGPKF